MSSNYKNDLEGWYFISPTDEQETGQTLAEKKVNERLVQLAGSAEAQKLTVTVGVYPFVFFNKTGIPNSENVRCDDIANSEPVDVGCSTDDISLWCKETVNKVLSPNLGYWINVVNVTLS